MTNRLYSCVCESSEHILIVRSDYDHLSFSIHLTSKPFLQRLISGIKYIFGYRCRYGDFDEILFDPQRALELGDRLVEWAQAGNQFFPKKERF